MTPFWRERPLTGQKRGRSRGRSRPRGPQRPYQLKLATAATSRARRREAVALPMRARACSRWNPAVSFTDLLLSRSDRLSARRAIPDSRSLGRLQGVAGPVGSFRFGPGNAGSGTGGVTAARATKKKAHVGEAWGPMLGTGQSTPGARQSRLRRCRARCPRPRRTGTRSPSRPLRQPQRRQPPRREQ